MILIIISILICLFLILLRILSFKIKINKSKFYLFECGFNPFITPRRPFSLQFFKILLIFLLFDIEIILILPLCIFILEEYIFVLRYILLILLLIFGLIYEWKEGNLEWLK